ncbi:hypothetical protein BJ165DRAFT_1182330 [Panaeolus papilionaceus]|nr:hypothetical protein BJ165DRAFT_1182330 [Panaeolus papilionaceus]
MSPYDHYITLFFFTFYHCFNQKISFLEIPPIRQFGELKFLIWKLEILLIKFFTIIMGRTA